MTQLKLKSIEELSYELTAKHADRATDESLSSRERLESKASAALFSGDLKEADRLMTLIERMDKSGLALVN